MKKEKLFFELLVIIIIGLFIMTNIGCDLVDDDIPDPVPVTEVGDTLWFHDRIAGDYFMGTSLARGLDGTIYYAVGGGTVYWTPSKIVAVDESDGSLFWMSDDLDHMDLSSQIVVGDDGTIYAIGYYTLYALDPDNGSFKWTWECPTELPSPYGPGNLNPYGQIGSLALLNNGDLVLGSVGSGVYSRALYGISKTGTMLWYNFYAVDSGIGGPITIGPNNSILYYDNYLLRSVDGNSGNIRWEKTIVSSGGGLNNIIVRENGELICSFIEEGASDFYLHRLDAANGNILWTSADKSNTQGQLLSPTEKVTQLVGNFHLFDLSVGNAQKFTEVNLGLPTAITNTNQYLVGSYQGSIYGCSTYNEDGTLDWHLGMDHMRGQVVIDNNKVMYGIRGDGKIFAVQSNAKLADSGWPKNGHDNRNTFNWSK